MLVVGDCSHPIDGGCNGCGGEVVERGRSRCCRGGVRMAEEGEEEGRGGGDGLTF
jgi:hypothetical protein